MNDTAEISIPSLFIEADPATFGRWMPLLTAGVSVEVELGCSVKELLCRLLDILPEELDRTVQTVFLEGQAVDDLDRARVSEGQTLALSAAMPGLAGATLRRGGPLAGMRSSISHQASESCVGSTRGRITVKLFNLVARDLGKALLSKGILLPGSALLNLVANDPSAWKTTGRIRLGDLPIQPDQLTGQLHSDSLCRLVLVFAPEASSPDATDS
jgi:hypothetical protein